MAEKIIVTFSGWCECDPDKVELVYLGLDKDVKEYITGREWLALKEASKDREDDGTIGIGPHRDDYTIMSCADAQATALDGNYDFCDFDAEEE